MGSTTTNTIYVRDASGNTMAVYTKDAAINRGAFTQTEISMYGSSRLGVWNINRNIAAITSIDYSNYKGSFTRANKLFELANHLGNVLVTVSDKKIGVIVAPQNGIVDYSVAEVVTANDYYPFGMAMPGRKFSQSSSSYRYGFNGMEKDNEVKGDGNHISFNDYGLDVRLGRRFGNDPIHNPTISHYAIFKNNPIFFFDPDGESPISIFAKMAIKQGIKKAAKEFIEAQIKHKVEQYVGKKLFSKALGKTLAKDAEKVLETLDTEWWEYVLEVIPVVGDIYGASSLGKKGLALWNKLDALQEKVQRVSNFIDRAKKGTSATLKAAMKRSGKALKAGEEAHHIIPQAAIDKSDAIMDAVGEGFDIHSAFNGIGMKAIKNGGEHGNAPQYTNQIVDFMNKWAQSAQDAGTYSSAAAKAQLENVVKQVTPQLEGIKGTGEKLNTIKLVIK